MKLKIVLLIAATIFTSHEMNAKDELPCEHPRSRSCLVPQCAMRTIITAVTATPIVVGGILGGTVFRHPSITLANDIFLGCTVGFGVGIVALWITSLSTVAYESELCCKDPELQTGE